MLTPLHSAIDTGEREKYLFLPLYGNTSHHLLSMVRCLQHETLSAKTDLRTSKLISASVVKLSVLYSEILVT